MSVIQHTKLILLGIHLRDEKLKQDGRQVEKVYAKLLSASVLLWHSEKLLS